ncbi:MAG TPA: T9SS type A sorting domain-containing protein, partial [Bacteroidota bacterium]|nr:T9SS type A sorting domain-containing protein [Bacteroidota bacterium]
TLMVLSSSAPGDFSSLTLSAKSVRLFRYDTFSFLTNARDKFGNMIILPHTMIQYSCASRLGSIAATGIFTPSDHADSGYVYAKFSNIVDSCYVKTYDFKYFSIRPKVAVTDTLRLLKLGVDTYDADNVRHDLAITRFKLTSLTPSVGTIDSTGTFTAKKNGTTKIVATLNGASDTSIVRVESSAGIVSLDQLDNVTGWKFDKTILDSLSVKTATDQKSSGTASFRIDYKVTYDPSVSAYMVYLSKDMLIFGIPDSIYLDVKSDGRRHKMYYLFTDANGGTFRASAKKYLNNSQIFDLVNTSLSDMAQVSGAYPVTAPLTLNRLEIQLAPDLVQGQSTSGTIYIDNLRLKYPGSAVTDVNVPAVVPAIFGLEQNFPNPFNPSTTIQYVLASRSRVELSIYNMLGQKVAELVNGEKGAGRYEVRFDARALASGIYFYQLQAHPVSAGQPGNFVETRKLVLLK